MTENGVIEKLKYDCNQLGKAIPCNERGSSLTGIKIKIFEFIKSYIKRHCYPPTVREIADNLEISVSSVHGHMREMIKEGILETDAQIGASRAIRIPGYKFIKGE